jgi:hypothetical protein
LPLPRSSWARDFGSNKTIAKQNENGPGDHAALVDGHHRYSGADRRWRSMSISPTYRLIFTLFGTRYEVPKS